MTSVESWLLIEVDLHEQGSGDWRHLVLIVELMFHPFALWPRHEYPQHPKSVVSE